MNPIFPEEEARHYCLETISLIESGYLQLEQVTELSEERKNQGVMVGSLVCCKKDTSQRLVLVSVSGISKKLGFGKSDTYCINGVFHRIVPPIVSDSLIKDALFQNDLRIHQLTEKIKMGDRSLQNKGSFGDRSLLQLKEERRKLTDLSLQKVFSLYDFFSFQNNQKISLNTIIRNHGNRLPPTGTGDCCAPKLLSYAFENNLEILSMDEVFYGESSGSKINGHSYTPCDERCGYILPSILGLDILYKDSSIIVVNKPSGILSVPGKGEEKQDCIVNRVKKLFPECIAQPSVHRLDMETSGIMVLGLTQTAHDELNRQFQEGLVEKKYEALLDGVLEKAKGDRSPKNGEKEGQVSLKFRVDLENRPHQIYDEIYGKLGITEWKKEDLEYYYSPATGEKRKVTRVTFIPHTGRTHQLRLAASHEKGLGLPIVGDSLYGKCEKGERLMLHAKELSFYHPVSGEKLTFKKKPEF